MGSALCARHPWAMAWSLLNGALAPDTAAAGLERVPGAPCSLTHTGPSPPGKGEGRISGSLPTRHDPGGCSLAVGNLASVTGKESQLSQSQAPLSYLGRSLSLQVHSGASLSRPTKQTVVVGTMWLSLRRGGREGTVRLPRWEAEAPAGPVVHPAASSGPGPGFLHVDAFARRWRTSSTA